VRGQLGCREVLGALAGARARARLIQGFVQGFVQGFGTEARSPGHAASMRRGASRVVRLISLVRPQTRGVR